jgi:hypothetical protein
VRSSERRASGEDLHAYDTVENGRGDDRGDWRRQWLLRCSGGGGRKVRGGRTSVTDIGAVGDSPGDILTFANEVYDAPNTKLVGHNNGWCIRIVVGQSWECFWTLTLARGQITVEGPFYDGRDSVLAITGGTGAFDDVRGEMALHARNEQGTEYDFVYALED